MLYMLRRYAETLTLIVARLEYPSISPVVISTIEEPVTMLNEFIDRYVSFLVAWRLEPIANELCTLIRLVCKRDESFLHFSLISDSAADVCAMIGLEVASLNGRPALQICSRGTYYPVHIYQLRYITK